MYARIAQSSQDFDFVVALIFTGGPVLSGHPVRCQTFYRSSQSTGSHRGSRTTKRNYTVLTSEVYINFTVYKAKIHKSLVFRVKWLNLKQHAEFFYSFNCIFWKGNLLSFTFVLKFKLKIKLRVIPLYSSAVYMKLTSQHVNYRLLFYVNTPVSNDGYTLHRSCIEVCGNIYVNYMDWNTEFVIVFWQDLYDVSLSESRVLSKESSTFHGFNLYLIQEMAQVKSFFQFRI